MLCDEENDESIIVASSLRFSHIAPRRYASLLVSLLTPGGGPYRVFEVFVLTARRFAPRQATYCIKTFNVKI